jgi:hypothetical protein
MPLKSIYKSEYKHKIEIYGILQSRILFRIYLIIMQNLGKTICKATTEELMAPKKKHLDC